MYSKPPDKFTVIILFHCLFSPENVLIKCHGKELTLDYFAKKGFRKPVLIESKDGLGLVVPKSSFSIMDVQQYIG
jgi:hypothetical protein